MKVLAFNGSPRKERGNTALILRPFLESLEKNGVQVEQYNVRDLNLKPCRSCQVCQFKNPGKCVQKDGMNEMAIKLAQSDVWIFATPLYIDGVPGPMKILFDRMILLIQPFYEIRGQHTRMKLREGVKTGGVVLVSTCGLFEKDNFDPLLHHLDALSQNMNRQLTGTLLRPHANFLKPMMEMGLPVEDIFEALRKAGRELAHRGEISDETSSGVSRELVSREDFLSLSEQYVKEQLSPPVQTKTGGAKQP